MACDFCVKDPAGVLNAYVVGHICAACDLLLLEELPATRLRVALENNTVNVRIWLELTLQTPHSYSLGGVRGGVGGRPAHRGQFHTLSPLPKTGAALALAYATYAAEARDIADQQVAQLRGHPGHGLIRLPAAAVPQIGFGTLGMEMNAAVQSSYVSPIGVRYELTWLHTGKILAARMHCYPDEARQAHHNLSG